ncbi:phage head morphogenesis protein, SPP1 gp7 family [Serratia entomophila]|uniref:phage minor head protein n=1 Tax=Serratia entomophila TaxID=42906 RepID=UPI001F274BF9|nr:phage minor head protein [Serratia entomophila]CAI0817616.1 phage head morphogenesis protein, SPP1 gp7 family [Serratia entomophila]CAI0841205.1 phage head morphogenesis protein, SPP1 gp7 family [Serratia entomophila]CAI0880404.1 phage head morphogenesis protein, SPP1 gp7 family [Serratia entomophila]CAI1051486.1 phage head morphogenesis protein, SPP1 gp7 family [Serratia entomophila]CAI1059065.1 phage head morphogenesis protein, SPP1 gp7 family [Serratia entomophila]
MITTAKPRIGTPIVPRNKADPTQSYRQVNKMFRDIESRYLGIKTALRSLLDQRLVGREIASNAQAAHAMHDGILYQVNAGAFIYDMTAQQLADLLEHVQVILDDYLLEGIGQDIWALTYIAEEYQRGTLNAYTNLSAQSPIYESQTTLVQLLSSPAYQNQIGAAYVSAYSDWKGISDKARTDLANVIADAIGRGISPRETARIVSKRLDVSMTQAKVIAQTEQVGALRQAQWQETDWARDRLGLNTKVLWLSALKPTTRAWHAARHGRTYTTEEVKAFYAENGNRYNCYCANIPVLVDDDGKVVNEGMVSRLIEEKKQWQDEYQKAA